MNDFLTEKNKKTGEGMLGKLEVGSLWLLHAFIPGSYWCIGEVYW